MGERRRPLLSVVTPAHHEAESLPLLASRLVAALDPLDVDWEWLVVDDHSADATFETVAALAAEDRRLRGIRLAHRAGSHGAIACGLAEARGDCAVVLAADLQDPPELVPRLLDAWRTGAHVVWGARADDRALGSRGPARLIWAWLRLAAGLDRLPPSGADVVLLDRVVLEALRRCGERPGNLFALIAWMGFRQASVPYDKSPRARGQSRWSFGRRLTLAIDSVVGFSDLPLRAMALVGALTAALGFGYAVVVLGNAWAGRPPQGWSSLMVAVLVLGGTQMAMLGVLGTYLWRALEEARGRPRYLVEATTEDPRSRA